MSVFISQQNYLTMAQACEQLNITLCEHHYKMWCKKEKCEEVKIILDKIKPIIEQTNNKNKMLSFDRILLMTMIDLLAKDKDYNPQNNVATNLVANNDDTGLTQKYAQDDMEATTLSNQSHNSIQEKNQLVNDVVELLQNILDNLNSQE